MLLLLLKVCVVDIFNSGGEQMGPNDKCQLDETATISKHHPVKAKALTPSTATILPSFAWRASKELG